ncbi:MAG: hypothetical protein E7059_01995 [Treponema bryantii]|nr:hypothetical protein [Treponema bryantii]
MKKIKKLIVSLILLMTLSSSCFAQFAVLDMANLSNAIQQMYQTYQQIQHAIEQVQNTYKQIEQAAQQVASMNWDDLSNLGDNFAGMAENPFEVITGVHKSAQDITKAVNDRMNDWNRLADSLQRETISFGGMNVSVADLCGFGDEEKNLAGFMNNAWENIEETADKMAAGYEGELTYEQKRAIMKKYGMSPRNYAKSQYANYQLNELVKEANVKGTAESMKATMEEQEAKVAALKQMIQNTPEGSLKASMENAVMAEVQALAEMQNMSNQLQQVISMYSNYISAEKRAELEKKVEEMKAREKAEKLTNQSKGFTDKL